MKIREYQQQAKETFQFDAPAVHDPMSPDRGELIPLLGLTGEIGALLSEYKKLLRDGPVHRQFKERLQEELGDTLWYVAAVATQFDLDLETVAAKNLVKVRERWVEEKTRAPLDEKLNLAERLPTEFVYKFGFGPRKDGSFGVQLFDGKNVAIGNPLTDNAHEADGYRFHDVMHFAFVAVLGWSPVARQLLAIKRQDKHTDEVEDGGRAKVIDEAIVAMVFSYINKDLKNTDGLKRIDSATLQAIRALTRGYEVARRAEADWEIAILKGLEVWRQVEAAGGGRIEGRFSDRTFRFLPSEA